MHAQLHTLAVLPGSQHCAGHGGADGHGAGVTTVQTASQSTGVGASHVATDPHPAWAGCLTGPGRARGPRRASRHDSTTPNKIALTLGRGRGPRALTGQDPGGGPAARSSGPRARPSSCVHSYRAVCSASPSPSASGESDVSGPPSPVPTPPLRRLEIRAGACSLPRRWQAATPPSVLPGCHAMPATRCPLFLPVSASAASRFHRCVYLLHKTSGHHGLQCSAADLQACAHLHCPAATASSATMRRHSSAGFRIEYFCSQGTAVRVFFWKIKFF